MNADFIITQLEKNISVFRELLIDVYASKNYQKVLNDFLVERKDSIKWLRSLDNPPYQNAYQHPKVGPLTGRLFLTNWVIGRNVMNFWFRVFK